MRLEDWVVDFSPYMELVFHFHANSGLLGDSAGGMSSTGLNGEPVFFYTSSKVHRGQGIRKIFAGVLLALWT